MYCRILDRADNAGYQSELLYALFFQGDGNFHLQQKSTAPDATQNPSMIGNRAYFVDDNLFKNYIKTRGAEVHTEDQQKVRTSRS